MAVRKHGFGRYVMDITGLTLLLAAAGCYALLYIVKMEKVAFWYSGVQSKLLAFEEIIESIEQWWIFLLVIALIYSVKSILPILSTSVVCIITGVVLPVYIAFFVNIIGLTLIFSIRYYMGRRFGGGNTQKLVYRNKRVRAIMEHGGKGNPWLLIVFRVFPTFPINSVSQLYGQMRFKYVNFILLSLLGYAPKLLSYTFIGRNVYNPLSAAFLTPIILLLTLSGISLLSINIIWKFVGDRRHIAQGKKNVEQNET